MVVPAAVVLGIVAVVVPVPPVALVPYHSRFVPVAVSAVAVAPWQYAIGVAAVGAAGVAFTFTTMAALGLSQFTVWLT